MILHKHEEQEENYNSIEEDSDTTLIGIIHSNKIIFCLNKYVKYLKVTN